MVRGAPVAAAADHAVAVVPQSAEVFVRQVAVVGGEELFDVGDDAGQEFAAYGGVPQGGARVAF